MVRPGVAGRDYNEGNTGDDNDNEDDDNTDA